MDYASLLIIAVSLSMDAFAVSIGNGAAAGGAKIWLAVKHGLVFGGFQTIMPIGGYFLGDSFISYIESVDHWIAFALLALIGGKMLADSLRARKNDETLAGRGIQGDGVSPAESSYQETGDSNNGSNVQGDGVTPVAAVTSMKRLIVLGIATSIDAFAVGISISVAGWDIWMSSFIIGAVTYIISFSGAFAGTKLGKRFQRSAGALGGAALIGIGFKILIEHLVA